MKHAVIYVYASGNQSIQSITRQINICKEYALHSSIEVIQTYSDITEPDMPKYNLGLKTLLKDSRTSSFDTVLISSFDRLASNLADLLIYYRALKIKDKNVISVTGFDADTQPMSLSTFLTNLFNEGDN